VDQSAPRHQAGETEEHAAPSGARSLKSAIVTAVVLLGLIAVCYALGTTAFFFLALVVVSIALWELLDALHQAGRRPSVVLGLATGAALMTVAFIERPVLIPVVLVAAVQACFVFALRPGRGATPASDVAWTIGGVAWIAGGGAAAVAMLKLPGDGLELLVGFVLVTAADDVAAYFAGTAFGKHKMAPSISPAKSWEGFAGGLAGALVGGAVFGLLVDRLTTPEGLAIGAVCGLLAPAGDLVESLVKRELGIKDSGRLLPGHGGFLDRLDAILFCAPPVYLFFTFVVF
jgi:phosphatidate cytidylyltransferase